MGILIRIGKPAGNLIDLNRLRICGKRKRHHSGVSQLFFHLRIIDGSSIDPGRCTSFKTVHLNAQIFQRIRQMVGGLQSIGPRVHAHVPVDAPGAQISSRTEYDRLRMINCPGIQTDACHMLVLFQNLRHFRLDNLQMLRIFQNLSHSPAVFCFIRLGAQRVHRRPLGYIQHLRLNKRAVNHLAHLSAQSIHFPHQMSFGASSNIGIAGHQGNTVHTDRKYCRFQPQSGTGKSRFTSGMTGSHHRYIHIFL